MVFPAACMGPSRAAHHEGEGSMTTTLESELVVPSLAELGAYSAPVLVAGALLQLSLLGTSERIAEFLLGLGIRGICGSARRCPIAEWLTLTLGMRFEPSPDLYEWPGVHDTTVNGRLGGHYVEASTPRPVADFLCDFDEERYPALTRPIDWDRR